MRRMISASVAVLPLGLTPVTGFAATNRDRPVAKGNPAITLVDGWWEQEHHQQDAPQRYWHMTPQQVQRYNHLQAEQRRREQQRHRFEQEDQRASQEQHRMLGFEMMVR
jgi:hypothetical protein